MGRELTPAELRELLPAFALDAVDEDEREEIRRYLERAPDARAELAELREVASLLAQPERDAPPDLWRRIEQSLEVEPPVLGITDAKRSPRRSRRMWLGRAVQPSTALGRVAFVGAALAIAGLLVTVVLLSREMSQQEDRVTQLAEQLEGGDAKDAALAMFADPHARTTTLWRDGHPSVPVVVMPDGRGYVMGEQLAPLPRNRTYQLWSVSGDEQDPTLVSTAVLGRDPGTAAFHGPASPDGFVVTNEPTPGVERSGGPVVATGRFE